MEDAKSLRLRSVEFCYRELGFSFTPLRGKKPFVKGWQSAPRETMQTAMIWAKNGNVGLRCGDASGGVVAIDIDVRHKDYTVEAVKALALPNTITARTGGGGWHRYYRLPEGVVVKNSTSALCHAVDVKVGGGQVVFPGSIHPDTGAMYTWHEGCAPWECDLAVLPPHLVERLQQPSVAPAEPPALPTSGGSNPGTAPNGQAYGRAALGAEIAALSGCGAGGRNNQLNKSAFALGQLVGGGSLDRAQAKAGLLAACITNGLVDEDGRSKIEYHIDHSLDAGAREPRAPSPLPHRDYRGRQARTSSAPPPESAEPLPAATERSEDGPPPPEDFCTITDAEIVDASPGGQAPTAHSLTPTASPVALGMRHPNGRLVFSQHQTLPTAAAYIRDKSTYVPSPDDAAQGVRPGRTLHSHAGRLVTWRNNHYVEIEDGAISHDLCYWLHDALERKGSRKEPYYEDFPSNPVTVSSVVKTLHSCCFLDGSRDVPFWISGGDGQPDPREILCCLRSNVHIVTGRRLPPTPDLMTHAALEYEYDPDASQPAAWLEFLRSVWPDDPAAIATLQEWFGYCLTADTSQQKMLLIVGPRRSGKGTIGRVLTEMIGRANVAGPTISSLSGQFGLQVLLGKSLALVSDARFSGPDLQAVVERLLCISGEDSITVDRKHLPSVTCRLPVRFAFLSNELPRFADAAGALAGRFVMLVQRHSFYGREDTALTSRLLAEMPGILLWAIDGWIRLRERGHFVTPESSVESVEMLMDLTSPVGAWLRQACVVAPDQRAYVQDLYQSYRKWCENEGRSQIPTVQTWAKDLVAVAPGLRQRRNPSVGRFYEGIGLRSEYAAPASPGAVSGVSGGSGGIGVSGTNVPPPPESMFAEPSPA